MKSFKLISLEVMDGDEAVSVPLTDGLIINKEDEHSTWLLEAYSAAPLYDFFKKIYEAEKEIIVQVIITKKDNDPAFFQTKVVTLNQFNDHISVLLEGHLRRTRRDYSELLLDSLLQKGFTGNALLNEFKDKMKRKPRIK